jgi:hypothetical protein
LPVERSVDRVLPIVGGGAGGRPMNEIMQSLDVFCEFSHGDQLR